ncbi:MAG: DUF1549 and DUF1553 domain-containing protein [Pirellulales bacterium]
MAPSQKPSFLSVITLAALWLMTPVAWAAEITSDLAAADRWIFQPPSSPVLPCVKNQSWSQGPIDRFILRRLEATHLAPAPQTDRRTLIRRATFDLTGLPPTRAEVQDFVTDKSIHAFEKVVDRLLASPHYGERWGRHWLDVVRYADSNGLDENVAQANAWRYRDYVIGALNHDKPFDQFVREQIAGDLLPGDDPAIRNERLTATGFLVLGPKVLAEVDETKMEMDIVDEQIDTIGKAFLGLTLGCARCHDHKFDPITTEDYYALAGILKSTHTMDSFTKVARWHENTLHDPEHRAALVKHEAAVASQQATIDELLGSATDVLKRQLGAEASLPAKPEESFPAEIRQQLKELRAELTVLKKSVPVEPSAMGVQDGKAVEAAVHHRGSHLTLGKKVPRRIPTVFIHANTTEIAVESSGRLDLANWLTSADNPLSARVIVNRVWRWHFGRGLVGTPDNFGIMGAAPTHPELLDWLALDFMQEGWSLKRLHRQIMLSATYQMNSEANAEAADRDPQNQTYWRFNIHRLEAEELRDALLSVSGQLNESMGGPSLKIKNREFVFNHTSKDETQYDSKRRSVYLPVIRNHLHDSFTLFDYNDASTSNGDRNTSTVASQALYLMNSPFLVEASQHLADRVLAETVNVNSYRVNWLYETTLGRSATGEEVSRLLEYLERFEHSAEDQPQKISRSLAWQALCQTVLMSSEFIYVR